MTLVLISCCAVYLPVPNQSAFAQIFALDLTSRLLCVGSTDRTAHLGSCSSLNLLLTDLVVVCSVALIHSADPSLNSTGHVSHHQQQGITWSFGTYSTWNGTPYR